MRSHNQILTGCLAMASLILGCASLRVGADVQAGRNALQTGRPQDAVAYLGRAAAEDANYVLPYRLGQNVLTYLGRAYYETGRNKEARATLEKALARDRDDHVARLYLGLTLLRDGERGPGEKELQSGLKGISNTIDSLAANPWSGFYWDPGRQIRGDIQRALTLKADSAEFVTLAERIGKSTDEEIERAHRDEIRALSRGADN
jgi:tetratricopeptide (TPR) repeat protein